MTGNTVRFATKSGMLIVSRNGDLLELDMRAANLTQVDEPELCARARPAESPSGSPMATTTRRSSKSPTKPPCAPSARLRGARQIRRMAVVTARGEDQDIASRVFVPYLGIDEDPVTGSAHAALVPYWAKRLGRSEFTALQASARTRRASLPADGDRVILGGHCHTVIVGQFQL